MLRKLQYVGSQFIYLFIYLFILKEVSRQIHFLGIYDVFNTDSSSNRDY